MLVFLLLLLTVARAAVEDSYRWEEKWHNDMPIDHFSFGDMRTFRLRYLINTEHWDAHNAGPVLFYCGNEMEIESFARNTGMMWDEAPRMRAMLLFVEHRYYGKSLPFGAESGTSLRNLQHLSSAQALADFAEVIIRLKETIPGMAKSPVIAIGGSYGAMLATWMRVKYPHVVVGAISSSGPILQLPGGGTPCWSYSAKVTKDFAQSGHRCDDTIRRSWPAVRRLASTEEGRAFLNTQYNVCPNSLLSKAEDADLIVSQVTSAMGNMAMLNYPYPTSFVKPLPTYPVEYSCKYLKYTESPTDEELAVGLHRVLNVFSNFTGQLKCLAKEEEDSAFGFWPYQCCTDITMPSCQNGTDMFEVSKWDWEANADACAKQFWGTRPRYNWAMHNYGSDKMTWATNIVFINGDMDPWEGGGVTKPYPGMHSSVHIINIAHAAHHLDLRSEHPLDPVWTKNARVEMRRAMDEWATYKI